MGPGFLHPVGVCQSGYRTGTDQHDGSPAHARRSDSVQLCLRGRWRSPARGDGNSRKRRRPASRSSVPAGAGQTGRRLWCVPSGPGRSDHRCRDSIDSEGLISRRRSQVVHAGRIGKRDPGDAGPSAAVHFRSAGAVPEKPMAAGVGSHRSREVIRTLLLKFHHHRYPAIARVVRVLGTK